MHTILRIARTGREKNTPYGRKNSPYGAPPAEKIPPMGLFSQKKYPLLQQNFSRRPKVCAILHEIPEKNTPYGAQKSVFFLGNARNLAFHPKNNTPIYSWCVNYYTKPITVGCAAINQNTPSKNRWLCYYLIKNNTKLVLYL